MKTQASTSLRPARSFTLDAGRAASLPAGAGELQVIAGRLWVTGHGRADLVDDHLLRAGERLRVGDGHALVLETWDRTAPVVLCWQPRAPAWQGVVYRFAARLRSAASTARRSQGCIAGGDSIASCGALK